MPALVEICVPAQRRERALLVGLERPGVDKWVLRESLEELAELAKSAGAEVTGVLTQHLDQPTAPYYIGKGKAEHAAELCKAEGVTSIIFDDELSPAQSRNLEQLTLCKVIDRTQLILDIFAQRARTRGDPSLFELQASSSARNTGRKPACLLPKENKCRSDFMPLDSQLSSPDSLMPHTWSACPCTGSSRAR